MITMRFLALFLALASTALAASLQQVSGWGSGPSGVSMYIYVPDNRASNPPIVVAAHPCGGTAQQMYGMTQMPRFADQYGFIIIYPQTTRDSNCWDVYRPESLRHNGGSDSAAINAMVSYTLRTYSGDSDRVYMMGSSSGAMMANVMAAAYPEVFEAAASFSGVPAGCFAGAAAATPMAPNQTCAQAQGNIVKSPEEWGNFARNMYPGYTGRRPRMQIWHGTADFLVVYAHLSEQLKQWSNVLGETFTRNVTGVPSGQYTQLIYGDGTRLQGYHAQGVGHTVPVFDQEMLEFFGLLGGSAPPPGGGGGGGGTTMTTTTTTAPGGPITQPPNPGNAQTIWGQCGGSGWSGPTSCVSTATCTTQNPYYAQCIPR